MRYVFFYLIVYFGFIFDLLACSTTDTHFYLVDEAYRSVLAINRFSGEEVLIPVGRSPLTMIIHQDTGYVFYKESSTVTVIDLDCNKVIKDIDVGADPHPMVIYSCKGYVVNGGPGTVTILDLKSNSVLKTIRVGPNPQQMVINGSIGYLPIMGEDVLTILDLESDTVTHRLSVGRKPILVKIYRDKGYVVNNWSDSVSVFDLETTKVLHTIPVSYYPVAIAFCEDTAYVVCRAFNEFLVLDLPTKTITRIIHVGPNPESLSIEGRYGYVKAQNSLSIINLEKNTLIKTLNIGQLVKTQGHIGYVKQNDPPFLKIIDLETGAELGGFRLYEEGSLNITDRYVYYKLNKICPLFPTSEFIKLLRRQKRLDIYTKEWTWVSDVGHVLERSIPPETCFDLMPCYLFVDEIAAKLNAADVLAILTTIRDPLRIINSVPGQNTLMPRLYTEFFRSVWLRDVKASRRMLLDFVRLQDPEILKLTTYKMLKRPVKSFRQNEEMLLLCTVVVMTLMMMS